MPFELRSLFDYKSAEKSLLRVRGEMPMPPMRLFTLVGECLHNLRSALDHLAWQLVLENGGQPTLKTTYPVLRRTPKAPLAVAGGVSDAAIAVIEESQPYQWASEWQHHPLYMLHDLARKDRHRHVALRHVALDNIVIAGTRECDGTWHRVAQSDDALTLEFVPDDRSIDVTGSVEWRLHIAEPPAVFSPPVATLTRILGYVRQEVVERCEREAFV